MTVRLTGEQKKTLAQCPHLRPVDNLNPGVLCEDTTTIDGERPYGPYVLTDSGKVQRVSKGACKR